MAWPFPHIPGQLMCTGGNVDEQCAAGHQNRRKCMHGRHSVNPHQPPLPSHTLPHIPAALPAAAEKTQVWRPAFWDSEPLVFSYANCPFYDLVVNFILAAKAAGLNHVAVIATGEQDL